MCEAQISLWDRWGCAHLSVVNDRHGGRLAAGHGHGVLALQAASHLPGERLVGRGARAHLATVVVTPGKDLPMEGKKQCQKCEYFLGFFSLL